MYRYTRKKARRDAICRRMRDGKARKREAMAQELGPRPAPYRPPPLRRVVIVIDYDLEAPVIDVFRLARTNRIDRYAVTHKGADVGGMGWANFCRRLSTHFPRLPSPASVA